jgi:mono/diheme cytochrome c family protein
MKSDAKYSTQPVREEAEPQVNYAPAPVIFFFILAAGVFIAGLFIDNLGGGFHQKVYAPYQSIEQLTAIQPVEPGGQLAKKGAQIYGVACTPCHQANGNGSPGQFPPLAGSEWVNTENPERMIRIVLNGFAGPVKVKDAEYNGAMPPWRDAYKDEDIAAVISFVRGNKDWGNKASAVKPEDVKKIRDATADRTTPWAADELLALPEK